MRIETPFAPTGVGEGTTAWAEPGEAGIEAIGLNAPYVLRHAEKAVESATLFYLISPAFFRVESFVNDRAFSPGATITRRPNGPELPG
jgi:hypothetical protein